MQEGDNDKSIDPVKASEAEVESQHKDAHTHEDVYQHADAPTYKGPETVEKGRDQNHDTNGATQTSDGDVADEQAAPDALNQYEILLGKIDALLDRLMLDA